VATEPEPCPNFATYRRRWPGRDPDFVCGDHADDSRLVAEACDPVAGAPKLLEPLSGTIKRIPCACTEGRVQIVEIESHE
jgi:hypothetical protein